MPNWKKVITSGSNAELAQIKLTDLSNQGSETTTLVINSSGVVGTRENAASSGSSGTSGSSGSSGTSGSSGSSGTSGADGSFGGATFDYTFSTSTGVGDPGTGKIRLNNSTQNAATAGYIDITDDDGTSIQAFLPISPQLVPTCSNEKVKG